MALTIKLIKPVVYRIIFRILIVSGWVFRLHPIKSKRIIFSQANNRYNGNSRYLFEYLCDGGFDVYWLSSSDAQSNKIPIKYQDKAIKRISLNSFIIAASSEYMILSHGSGDFGFYWPFFRHKKIVNLWHAITTKNIGVLDEKLNAKKINSQHYSEIRYYSAMISSSDIDRYTTSAMHHFDSRNVYVTGIPKADKYIRSYSARSLVERCLSKFKILYAPTFRDYKFSGDLFFPFDNFNASNLNNYFSKNPEVKFFLRPHPGDKPSNVQARNLEMNFPDNIVYFSQEICDDVDARLHEFDIIITDYSSIYLEPLLGDTPCIFIPFDKENYIATRGLAYDYDLVTPGPKVLTFDDLLQAIADAQSGAIEWGERRSMVKDMFFKYKDDGACFRISTQILGLTIN